MIIRIKAINASISGQKGEKKENQTEKKTMTQFKADHADKRNHTAMFYDLYQRSLIRVDTETTGAENRNRLNACINDTQLGSSSSSSSIISIAVVVVVIEAAAVVVVVVVVKW
ncbi:hypothetical protein ElyMa_006319000 [Elysia marginata]|uniref:Uncharacterized protein n=1 Tax=Elysia marginata TaxID=1093978 RepID=A0AAV4HG52_9GAST|nr:hypothetical protein ElyMa_006319000 [Elysia marginata]